MSARTFAKICERIVEHCQAHNKVDISLVFHGGEPLLGGVRHLRTLLEIAREKLGSSGLRVRLGIQSNGTLFSAEIGDLLLEHGCSLGISLDGPPSTNDRHRVDHRGRGSSAQLEPRLRLLSSSPYSSIFGGFLVVVDPEVEPTDTIDYLLTFAPQQIDFILPYDHWDRRPKGKHYFEATPYGKWLIAAFEHWYRLRTTTKIRMFNSMIRLMVGGQPLVESTGISPITIVVVETNGGIEAVDSLKGTYDGATILGLNVFDHSFEQAAQHVGVQSRQKGMAGLCNTCRGCQVASVCGGGYVPHRYSSANGFDNPSIYCRDLERIIRHIHARLMSELNIAGNVPK